MLDITASAVLASIDEAPVSAEASGGVKVMPESGSASVDSVHAPKRRRRGREERKRRKARMGPDF
jgi:hypothetical protein